MAAAASSSATTAPSPSASTPPASLNQPDNTAFTQQRLPAWQPLLSAGTVLPLFFVLGAAFLAIGLGLFFSSQDIQESEHDYTEGECALCANQTARWPPPRVPCTCQLRFALAQAYPAPVCLYYQLSNYYQNNRRYSVSRDDRQLFGDAWALRNPAEACQPYRWSAATRLPIAPCGAIANSLFNDTFELFRQLDNGTWAPVPLDTRGISWWTDTNVKFHNPEAINGSLAEAFKGTAKPPNWHVPAYDLSKNINNTGFVNEHFIVWMRIAALPTFRKLYSRIHQSNFSKELPAGNYSLNITYNYPVLAFHGRKKVILSTLSWMGSKNQFLGIAYLVFGSLCFLTGLVMLVVHFKYKDQNDEDE